MALLGTKLMGGLMSHTDSEKLLRPWWDAIEDFVIYGLIMLGLIVTPTTIFNGTPLFCTLCTQVDINFILLLSKIFVLINVISSQVSVVLVLTVL